MTEILLDCRELEAPEPLELLTKSLPKIDDTTHIKMLHRFVPVMLFDILTKNGYTYEVSQNDAIQIIIKKKK